MKKKEPQKKNIIELINEAELKKTEKVKTDEDYIRRLDKFEIADFCFAFIRDIPENFLNDSITLREIRTYMRKFFHNYGCDEQYFFRCPRKEDEDEKL